MNRALTGIRPTGDLTIANYVGAMQPIVGMQDTYEGEVSVFVADLHGFTDQEPELVNGMSLITARSLLAAGVDPNRTTMYLQTEIEDPTLWLSNILGRHTTIAEQLRVPTLKEKVRGGKAENATMALFNYPLLMAADIIAQDATDVPVGKDQAPHIEVTRLVARRFNHDYGNGKTVLVEPNIMATEGVRIAALNGDGKMSKSNPNSAIFLKDSPSEVAAKVKRAQTAPAGETSPALESHFTLAEALCTTPEQKAVLTALRQAHSEGRPAMRDFKDFLTERTNAFLGDFQGRYDNLTDAEVLATLRDGSEKAQDQAEGVRKRARKALGIVALLG